MATDYAPALVAAIAAVKELEHLCGLLGSGHYKQLDETLSLAKKLTMNARIIQAWVEAQRWEKLDREDGIS